MSIFWKWGIEKSKTPQETYIKWAMLASYTNKRTIFLAISIMLADLGSITGIVNWEFYGIFSMFMRDNQIKGTTISLTIQWLTHQRLRKQKQQGDDHFYDQQYMQLYDQLTELSMQTISSAILDQSSPTPAMNPQSNFQQWWIMQWWIQN